MDAESEEEMKLMTLLFLSLWFVDWTVLKSYGYIYIAIYVFTYSYST